MDQVKTGSYLKQLRNEKGMTQAQLAEHFGVSDRTISRWETGSNMPDLALMVELADFYAVDLRELIDGERKRETMNTQEKETLLLAAEYAEREKEVLMKRVRMISIVGVVTMVVYALMNQLEDSNPLPIYSFLSGVCFGISLGALLCAVLYTTGVLLWLSQRKSGKSKKGVLIAVIVACCAAFLAAIVKSL